MRMQRALRERSITSITEKKKKGIMMKFRNTAFVAAAVLAGTVGLTQQASAVLPTYTLVELGDLTGGGFMSRAFDINDDGTIVGISDNANGSVATRWNWGSQTPDALPGLDGMDFARASHINNNGLIGGFLVDEDLDPTQRKHAFVYDDVNGHTIFLDDLNDPDIKFSRFSSLSDDGVVTGFLGHDTLGGNRGYVYDSNVGTYNLLDPIGPDGNHSLAHDRNSSGFIVGNASEFPGFSPARVAVTWNAGDTAPTVLGGLDDFAGYQETRATYVSENGIIFGSGGNRNADNELFAQNENWVWDPNTQTATSMGFLAGFDWTSIGDISDDGSLAVGKAYMDGEEGVVDLENHIGIIWTADTGWVDVNTLITGGPAGYTIVELKGINADGYIVGTAINATGGREAIVLVPTPGGLALFSIAGMSVFYRRRRRC